MPGNNVSGSFSRQPPRGDSRNRAIRFSRGEFAGIAEIPYNTPPRGVRACMAGGRLAPGSVQLRAGPGDGRIGPALGSVPHSDRSGDDVRDLSAIVAYLSRTRGRTGRDGPFTRLTTTRERVAYASSRTAYASSRAPRRRLTDARGRTRQPVWRWCRSDERRRHDAREPR